MQGCNHTYQGGLGHWDEVAGQNKSVEKYQPYGGAGQQHGTAVCVVLTDRCSVEILVVVNFSSHPPGV